MGTQLLKSIVLIFNRIVPFYQTQKLNVILITFSNIKYVIFAVQYDKTTPAMLKTINEISNEKELVLNVLIIH